MSVAKHTRMIRTMACAVTLAATAALTAGCGGLEMEADYPDGYGDYPPDAYIATTEPYYFEGHAAYWYGGRWNYRDGAGRWNHYDHEPAGLYQRRMQGAARRHTYESGGRGRGGGHSGGGRHGGHR